MSHRDFLGSVDQLQSGVGTAINGGYLEDEAVALQRLLPQASLPAARRTAVQARVVELVTRVRAAQPEGAGLDALLRQYDLTTPEGVILMCLAEALLRIPDAATADRLIADKLAAGDWERHLGDSSSLLVNASTWGLMLTGRLIDIDPAGVGPVRAWFGRLAARITEPVARAALRQAMRVMGSQFVMGRDIVEALQRSQGLQERRYRHSFDMLGEAALTRADAQRYFDKYREAILVVGAHRPGVGWPQHDPDTAVMARPGISVKLSALHPRYEFAQGARVLKELAPKLVELLRLAAAQGIGLTVDAEEAERLELSLQLVDAALRDPAAQYGGFGLAVQAYQKRAPQVLGWLIGEARARRVRLCVRLVKGAYWDTEIKRAQERGLAGFPVFTRKHNTDVSWMACARQLAGALDVIYPQFATHNAHSVAFIAELMTAVPPGSWEYQRLHGMGEELYAQVMGPEDGPGSAGQAAGGGPEIPPPACRVYAPVGAHEDLLPYLVRRLLENGANTSFVNRIVDARLPIEQVVADPVLQAEQTDPAAHPGIALPAGLFGARRNSQGVNFADGNELLALKRELETASPSAPESVSPVTPLAVEQAVATAAAAWPAWEGRMAEERAGLLERAADLFEQRRAELIACCVQEAGRTVPDSVAEVREAIDFLRYYAARARDLFQQSALPGPTGELNVLRVRGRGVFACISPWNFPVSIFTGQVAATLVTGNTVIAKPAEQTPLAAMLAVRLLHQAGVPGGVLQLLPGDGTVGAALTRDPRISGVVFTGSTETACLIARSLDARDAALPVLIAETGGINAMLVDSSALPEQVVLDVMTSAFNSAGQRCSALRLLLLQEEIAPRVLELLAGQMDELQLGDPGLLTTDVGPVIDAQAFDNLRQYVAQVRRDALWSHQTSLPSQTAGGRFVAPVAVEVCDVAAVSREVFGPVLHIVRFRADQLPAMVDAVNAKGFGLTLGIHTRIDGVAQQIAARARVGNVYVNRNMIGAVVGAQPFGGCGLSGTGPKAGGPHYLSRLVTEQVVTTNTAALGGNTSLLALG